MNQFKKLSFIIPAHNEEKYLADILDKVIELKLSYPLEKELIIINDFSSDKTQEIIDGYKKKYNFIKSIINEKNLGKSQSVKKGILNSTGDLVVIQDADLEYEPEDLNSLLTQVFEYDADVVYGNRFGYKNKVIYWQNYFGNKTLSLISNLFTYFRIKTYLPDMEVCYKMVKGDIFRDIAKGITATSNFGFEPEITAKLSKYKINDQHLKFKVVPIKYYPRSVAEGKKMKAVRDGLKALGEILKYNF